MGLLFIAAKPTLIPCSRIPQRPAHTGSPGSCQIHDRLKRKHLIFKAEEFWELPGGLVVRIPGFHCGGPGSILGRGTEILQAVQCGKTQNQTKQKPKQNRRIFFYSGEVYLA